MAPRCSMTLTLTTGLAASDALGVINALGRGEEVGEIVELVLTAADG